jgi:plastocyanin
MRTTAVAFAGLLGLAACSDDSSVGDDVVLEGGSSTTACRLGECTTTTSTTALAVGPGSTTTTARAQRTTTTAAAAQTTTTTRPTTTTTEEVAIVVKIQSDTAGGGQFNPSQVAVPRNGLLRWTNTDSVARSVQGDNAEFRSPAIPPGSSFDYRPTRTGVINYHDGTRPYAVASIEVY